MSRESFFKSLFTHKEKSPKEQEDNSFAGMARQLRMREEAKHKETEELSNDISEYLAKVTIDVLHLTGTALGNKLHDMLMGESADNQE